MRFSVGAVLNGAVWLSIISSAPGKQGYKSADEANAWKDAQGAASAAIVLDPDGTMGKTFAAKTTPHMYIIDESQTLVYQARLMITHRLILQPFLAQKTTFWPRWMI